jgi:hypothetical protein
MASEKQVKCIWSMMGWSFSPLDAEDASRKWRTLLAISPKDASLMIAALSVGKKDRVEELMRALDVLPKVSTSGTSAPPIGTV